MLRKSDIGKTDLKKRACSWIPLVFNYNIKRKKNILAYFIMRIFIIFTLYQILLGWSNWRYGWGCSIHL